MAEQLSRQRVEEIIKGAPKGSDPNRIVQKLVDRGYQIEGLELPQSQQTQQGLGSQLQERYVEGVSGAAGALVDTATGRTDPVTGARRFITRPLGAAGRAIGDVAGRAFSAITPDKVEEKIAETVEPVTQPIAERYQKLQETNPELARDIDDVLGISELFGLSSIARPIKSAVSNTFKRVSEPVSNNINRLAPQSKEGVVNTITKAYEDSFFGMKTIKNRLEKLARIESTKDNSVSKENLVRELAEEGHVPEVEGQLASFDPIIRELGQKRREIVETEITPVLSEIDQRVSLDSIKQLSEEAIRRDATGADLKRSLAENERIFDSYAEKFGTDDITATQLNEIRVEMNDRTSAFDREIFEQDVSNQIGNVTRDKIDELAPEITEANQRISKLFRMEKTVKALDNQPVSIGVLGSQIGRAVGATALGTAGFSTGSASLVIAGIGAHYGGEAVANFLRKRRFSPKLKENFIKAVNQNPELKENIIQSAPPDVQTFLQGVFTGGVGAIGQEVIEKD